MILASARANIEVSQQGIFVNRLVDNRNRERNSITLLCYRDGDDARLSSPSAAAISGVYDLRYIRDSVP